MYTCIGICSLLVTLDVTVPKVFEKIADRIVLRSRLLEGRNWFLKLVPAGLVVLMSGGLGFICWTLLATAATVLLGDQKVLMRFQSLITTILLLMVLIIISIILAGFQSPLHHFNLSTALVGL